jgi:putative OPT family oligopeptide transporter
MIFSLPSLVIIEFWEDIDWFQSSGIALVGGVLGVIFAMPIRRALILNEPMDYMEGTATAEVINAMLPPQYIIGTPDYIRQQRRNRKSILLLLLGVFFGAAMKMCASTFFLWQELAHWGIWVASKFVIFYGMTFSPSLTSVGYIVGWRGATNMLIGSVLCWWVFTPVLMVYEGINYPPDAPAVKSAVYIWGAYTRFIGIGSMLLGGAAILLILIKPLVVSTVRSAELFWQYRKKGISNVPLAERDLPSLLVLIILLLLIVPLSWICWNFSRSIPVTAFSIFGTILFGFLFSCITAYMAGFGASQNPILGVTLSTIILSALVLLLILGFENPIGPPCTILLGSFICCVASVSGESLQDYKTGHIVGSTPWKQQIMQTVGLFGPALVVPVIISLLIKAYGIGQASENVRKLENSNH